MKNKAKKKTLKKCYINFITDEPTVKRVKQLAKKHTEGNVSAWMRKVIVVDLK